MPVSCWYRTWYIYDVGTKRLH